jgi:DNA-binding IclR family transcriptional regulator
LSSHFFVIHYRKPGIFMVTRKSAGTSAKRAPGNAAKKKVPAPGRTVVSLREEDEIPGTGEDERYIVPALRRGLAVLRLFTADRRVISLPEIIEELDVSRATGFRLAFTLEADGYLQRAPHSNAFQLGLNVLSLGFEYLASLDLLHIARPILEELRDSTDASVHMGVRDGPDIVYVLSAPSQHRLRSNVSVGSRMPAYATSIGHAMLFDASLEDLRKLYRGVKMQRFSEQTPANVDEFFKKLEEERSKGYVSYRSAYASGIASVAAPVRDQSGRIVAGVNVSDYESLPAMQDLDGVLKDKVLRAALAISRDLGFRPASATARINRA